MGTHPYMVLIPSHLGEGDKRSIRLRLESAKLRTNIVRRWNDMAVINSLSLPLIPEFLD